jgi:hypothetical protein
MGRAHFNIIRGAASFKIKKLQKPEKIQTAVLIIQRLSSNVRRAKGEGNPRINPS